MYREQFEKETEFKSRVEIREIEIWYYYKGDIAISKLIYMIAYSQWLESKLKERDRDLMRVNGLKSAYRDAWLESEKKLKERDDAMKNFINRVNKGEIRSKKTYAQFKEILKKS